MRGFYTGVQARIREENPIALYVHCYAPVFGGFIKTGVVCEEHIWHYSIIIALWELH